MLSFQIQTSSSGQTGGSGEEDESEAGDPRGSTSPDED